MSRCPITCTRHDSGFAATTLFNVHKGASKETPFYLRFREYQCFATGPAGARTETRVTLSSVLPSPSRTSVTCEG